MVMIRVMLIREMTNYAYVDIDHKEFPQDYAREQSEWARNHWRGSTPVRESCEYRIGWSSSISHEEEMELRKAALVSALRHRLAEADCPCSSEVGTRCSDRECEHYWLRKLMEAYDYGRAEEA